MKIVLQILVVFVLVFASQSTTAQLFGPRTLGRNARGNQMTDTATAGTVTEDRRFVRGARSADNFVGADRTEASVFVGNTQATNNGEVSTAVETLREQPTINVNRNAREPRRGMYRARLRIAFSLQSPPQPGSGTATQALPPVVGISQPLQELSAKLGFQISHVPTERVATLSGTVQTMHDRQIAELLAMFEPGVETVKNDLQVESSRQRSPVR